uniref:hydroxyacylglutathione hydrolase n=1 Tax=Cajanus cajan TaxID=3821 RepID=A0A151SG57_CAJCA|nr:Hydroxyacylglutathione hydrolase cytoplasmic [Cajanus cajan]
MKIYHVPCLQDSYSYLIVDESSREGAVVDPVEPEKVLEAANSHGVNLKLVLTSHRHGDHAGGNEKIKQLVPGIKVYGGSVDNVKGCTDKVQNGDKVSLGADVNILSLHTPWVRVLYHCLCVKTKRCILLSNTCSSLMIPYVFIAGCGKFFEGTAEQMYQSLCVTLGSLPKSTRVYCGHEYAEKNLQFALTIEPDNSRIQQKLTWAQNQKQAGLPTIPSTIEEEMETNPFMRVDLPALQEKIGCKSPIEALRELRKVKDKWKG